MAHRIAKKRPFSGNLKIVSGGQTGVDRGALDAALQCNIPCGGWCPEGRKAEDGVIPDRYPVEELPGGGYLERTLKNVLDSDGTVIIYFAKLSGGTQQTLYYCQDNNKPYLLINASEIKPETAAQRIAEFIKTLSGEKVNCAGPRHSNNKNGYGYTMQTITKFIGLYKKIGQ